MVLILLWNICCASYRVLKLDFPITRHELYWNGIVHRDSVATVEGKQSQWRQVEGNSVLINHVRREFTHGLTRYSVPHSCSCSVNL